MADNEVDLRHLRKRRVREQNTIVRDWRLPAPALQTRASYLLPMPPCSLSLIVLIEQ